MAKSATTTYDHSKVSAEVLEGPATWNQIKGISYHFGKTGFSLKGKLDSTMHAFVLDYVKSRILEDMGQVEPSQYFRTKFENGIQKKPTRKSGIRTLLVPEL